MWLIQLWGHTGKRVTASGGVTGLSALRVTQICRLTGLSGPRTKPSQARFGSRGLKAVLCAEQFHDQDYEQNKNR